MLSHLFLGMSLLGAEWVLYLLVILSIFSVTLIFERIRFYREATRGLSEFRAKVRTSAANERWADAIQAAQSKLKSKSDAPDLESEMAFALLSLRQGEKRGKVSPDVLTELASDAVMRARLAWDRNLSALATIGNIAPFIGLFGTVLGIIKAFHHLSEQAMTGAATVTSGISDALVATAIGLLVAIPASVAYNLFQRRVKAALTEAEALKSFLVGKLAD